VDFVVSTNQQGLNKAGVYHVNGGPTNSGNPL
jgi:hypothetical protein